MKKGMINFNFDNEPNYTDFIIIGLFVITLLYTLDSLGILTVK